MDDPQGAGRSAAEASEAGDAVEPWTDLAAGYESARAREDSFDRILEWPAQRAALGDVKDLSVLDVGCGDGSKVAQLVRDGAKDSVGLDISGHFITDPPPGLQLLRADMSALSELPELTGRRFDRITFLQSIGYAADPVDTLRTARSMLTTDGFILLTRTQPVRYAIQRAEENGTSLGEEYFSRQPYTFRHTGWNEQVALTKRPYTISDLLNTFSAAGLWIEAASEPQLSEDARRQFSHKQEWLDKHLGILMFTLRPMPDTVEHRRAPG